MSDTTPTPVPADAVAFLRLLFPTAPWALVSFPTDKKGAGHFGTFDPAQSAEAEAWIAQENGVAQRQVYYHVNTLRPGKPRKATKEDISQVVFLHVDVDLRVNEPRIAGRERILHLLTDKLPDGVQPPTYIIDSANGYQALWRLDKPFAIGPDNPPEEVERYTRWLESQLVDADSTHNVDRILRLPGTVNWKADKNHVPSLAKLEASNPERVYPLSAFKQLPPLAVAATTHAAATTGGTIKRLKFVDDLPASVSGRTKVIICQGIDPDEPNKHPSRSEWLFDVCCNLVRAGVDDDTIYSVITDPQFTISESVLEKGRGTHKYALKQIRDARATVKVGESQQPTDNSDNGHGHDKPSMLDLAHRLLKHRGPHLIHLNDEYHAWKGGAYQSLEGDTMRQEAYKYLESISAKPGQGLVTNVLDALCSLVHLERREYVPPCWKDHRTEYDPRQLLVCRNGLLHLPTGKLLDHDPAFLTYNALDYDYDPNANEPKDWLAFLSQVWPSKEEHDCIDAMQQWFGYLLTPNTSQQKIQVLVGPKRSGKGTTARVGTALLGHHNVCSPRISQFGEQFGLQSLIGKQLALISDLRLGNRSDKAAIAEALLNISGEDRVTVARKNREDWEGQLLVRFWLLCNEPPALSDPSGALPSRFIVLQMRQSFYGREDTSLTERLLTERSGILNWAITGWKMLRDAGRLTQPKSSLDTVRQIDRLASEVLAFVEDCCELISGEQTDKNALYQGFVNWARKEGMTFCPKKEQFGKELLSAFCGKVRPGKPRSGGKRMPTYEGIKLLESANDDEQDSVLWK